jgi:hypothetical protein
MTIIRRERRLPQGAMGEGVIREGTRVDPQDVVLRGLMPSDFVILDALKPLGLRRAEQLMTGDALQVNPGDSLNPGELIAKMGRKVLKSPVRAVFSRIEAGQVILQTNPEPVEVRALCSGEVTSVRGTQAVLIETIGALLQAAWGNGHKVFSIYQMEPKQGIESLQGETLLPEYRGAALVTTKPITTPLIFSVAVQQEMTAIIAPSMRSDLRELALKQTIPVILTEGFGELQMSEIVYNWLRDNLGRQALIDATEPARWSPDRPEIIVPLPTGGTLPPLPIMDQPLVPGVTVRMTRAPLNGLSGRVRRLPDTPRSVENGLRLQGAEVQLPTGRTVFVPLANLDMLGRPVDAPGGA